MKKPVNDTLIPPSPVPLQERFPVIGSSRDSASGIPVPRGGPGAAFFLSVIFKKTVLPGETLTRRPGNPLSYGTPSLKYTPR